MSLVLPTGTRHVAWLGLITVVATLLAVGLPASAHSVPLQSFPTQGQVLASAPDQVWVEFSGPIHRDGTYIRVIDLDNTQLGEAMRIEGSATPRITLETPDLPDGAYRIQWQTYSASDGHTVSGSIGFAVGEAAAPEGSTAADVRPLHVVGRILAHVGLALGIGTAAFARFVGEPRNWTKAAAATLAFGGASIAVSSGLATGLGWQIVASDPLHLTRIIAALAPLAHPVGWIVAAAPWAAMGHATQGVGLLFFNEWLHVVVVSAWAGGLVQLTLAETSPETARRFGRMASWCLGVGLLTGFMAWASIGMALPEGLWGWSLWTKLFLVVAMAVLAARNRISRNQAGQGYWRRTVGVEAGAGVAVMVIAGLLLSSSPVTPLAVEPPPGQDEGLHVFGEGDVHRAHGWLTPTPTPGAVVSTRLQILDDEGDPVENNTCGRDSCAVLRWFPSQDEGSRQSSVLRPTGGGWWQTEGITIQAGGNYTWQIVLQTASVYQDTIAGNFTV